MRDGKTKKTRLTLEVQTRFSWMILMRCSSWLIFLMECQWIVQISPHQTLTSKAQICVDRHSQSLDDVRLFPPPAPLGTTLPPDSTVSYMFGLPDASINTKTPVDHSLYPLLHCKAIPSFYGRRSSNCLSLDMLGDEQILEFIL